MVVAEKVGRIDRNSAGHPRMREVGWLAWTGQRGRNTGRRREGSPGSECGRDEAEQDEWEWARAQGRRARESWTDCEPLHQGPDTVGRVIKPSSVLAWP